MRHDGVIPVDVVLRWWLVVCVEELLGGGCSGGRERSVTFVLRTLGRAMVTRRCSVTLSGRVAPVRSLSRSLLIVSSVVGNESRLEAVPVIPHITAPALGV